MYRKRDRSQWPAAGFSLAELLVVVALLAIIALVVLPDTASVRPLVLDRAASEVADALRHARSEALRSGEPKGVYGNVGVQRLRLYHLDDSGLLPQRQYNIYHPQDKKLYDLQFGVSPLLQEVSLNTVKFKFVGMVLPVDYLDFDASGIPSYDDGVSRYRLQEGTIKLSYRGQLRVVTIDPLTGRVSGAP